MQGVAKYINYNDSINYVTFNGKKQSESCLEQTVTVKTSGERTELCDTFSKQDCSVETCTNYKDLFKLGLQEMYFNSIEDSIRFTNLNLKYIDNLTGVVFPLELFTSLCDMPPVFVARPYSQEVHVDDLKKDTIVVKNQRVENYRDLLAASIYLSTKNSIIISNNRQMNMYKTIFNHRYFSELTEEITNATFKSNSIYIGKKFRTKETESLLEKLTDYTGDKHIVLNVSRFNYNKSIPDEILNSDKFTVVTDRNLQNHDHKFTFEYLMQYKNPNIYFSNQVRGFINKYILDRTDISYKSEFDNIVDFESTYLPYKTAPCTLESSLVSEDFKHGVFVPTFLNYSIFSKNSVFPNKSNLQVDDTELFNYLPYKSTI